MPWQGRRHGVAIPLIRNHIFQKGSPKITKLNALAHPFTELPEKLNDIVLGSLERDGLADVESFRIIKRTTLLFSRGIQLHSQDIHASLLWPIPREKATGDFRRNGKTSCSFPSFGACMYALDTFWEIIPILELKW